MARNTRYSPSAAADRARTAEMPASDAPVSVPAAPLPATTSGEYTMLSVWRIRPAPWQSRRVFEHLEELAATIEGDAETEGVGVLEPVLVRRTDDGYELIDGERRLRAGQLIAKRSVTGDYLLPARVFHVSVRVARLMGQTANLERDEPKPYEVALGYQSIREALRDEAGEEATSARALAGLGRHKKTQVADYLAIADALTPDVLAAAGLVDGGVTSFGLLAKMTKKELHRAAKLKAAGPEECAAALKARVERLLGVAPTGTSKAAGSTPSTPEERRVQISTEVGFALRVRAPAQMMAPADARALVENELAPAMLAMVERAHGGTIGEGFYAAAAATHTLVVVPGEVETLTAAQLERLGATLAALRSRTERAMRQRRRSAPRASAA